MKKGTGEKRPKSYKADRYRGRKISERSVRETTACRLLRRSYERTKFCLSGKFLWKPSVKCGILTTTDFIDRRRGAMGRLPMEADILPPSDDRVFKLILTDPGAKPGLMKLISAVIGRNVVDVTLYPNEPPPGSTEEKAERLDINCKIGDGSQVNLEMQASRLQEAADGQHKNLKCLLFDRSALVTASKRFAEIRPVIQNLSNYVLFLYRLSQPYRICQFIFSAARYDGRTVIRCDPACFCGTVQAPRHLG